MCIYMYIYIYMYNQQHIIMIIYLQEDGARHGVHAHLRRLHLVDDLRGNILITYIHIYIYMYTYIYIYIHI